MKKSKIAMSVLVLLTICPIINAGAEGLGAYKTLDELIEKYSSNSSQAESISLHARKQALDDYTVTNSIAELEKQIESNNSTIRNLEKGKGSGTFSEQQYQADYQRIYGYELEMKLELYKMQEQLDLLYSDYSEKITEQQNNQLELEACTILWNIHTNDVRQAYLVGLNSQKEHELSVIRETLKLGYATESDVLAVEAELEQAKAELAACENNSNMLIKKYELSSGDKSGEYSVEYTETAYSAEDLLKEFEKKSFYPEYYRRQAETYQTYAETLKKLKKDMLISAYNKEYFDRVQEYIDNESEYYINEASLAENSAKRYSEELELFVYEICGNVNSLTAQRKTIAAELKTAEKQAEISRAMLEEGRINKTSLLEAENSVLKLKAELAEVEAEIMCKKFILDNQIESFGN